MYNYIIDVNNICVFLMLLSYSRKYHVLINNQLLVYTLRASPDTLTLYLDSPSSQHILNI